MTQQAIKCEKGLCVMCVASMCMCALDCLEIMSDLRHFQRDSLICSDDEVLGESIETYRMLCLWDTETFSL